MVKRVIQNLLSGVPNLGNSGEDRWNSQHSSPNGTT
jgi:hypothetical protein